MGREGACAAIFSKTRRLWCSGYIVNRLLRGGRHDFFVDVQGVLQACPFGGAASSYYRQTFDERCHLSKDCVAIRGQLAACPCKGTWFDILWIF